MISASEPFAFAAIFPSTTNRSPTSSRPFAGSTIRPLRITVFMASKFLRRNTGFQPVRPADILSAAVDSAGCKPAGRTDSKSVFRSCRDPSAEIEDGHADRETVGYLLEDDALGAIGQFAVDLDAAIDRPGMHDEAIGLEPFAALLRQAKEPHVFADPWEIFLSLTFVLNPKQIDHVRRLEDFVQVVRNGHAEFFKFVRYQRARADEGHARAEFQEPEDIRARHAAEENVADDSDVQSRDGAFMGPDRVEFQQR